MSSAEVNLEILEVAVTMSVDNDRREHGSRMLRTRRGARTRTRPSSTFRLEAPWARARSRTSRSRPPTRGSEAHRRCLRRASRIGQARYRLGDSYRSRAPRAVPTFRSRTDSAPVNRTPLLANRWVRTGESPPREADRMGRPVGERRQSAGRRGYRSAHRMTEEVDPGSWTVS